MIPTSHVLFIWISSMVVTLIAFSETIILNIFHSKNYLLLLLLLVLLQLLLACQLLLWWVCVCVEKVYSGNANIVDNFQFQRITIKHHPVMMVVCRMIWPFWLSHYVQNQLEPIIISNKETNKDIFVRELHANSQIWNRWVITNWL